MNKKKVELLFILLLIPLAYSVQIDEGVELQPNESASYYVVNNTFYVDEMIVYEDNITFDNLDAYNTTIAVLDSDGNEASYLSDLKSDTSIPQTITVKNIYFRVSQAIITYTHRYGAGIVSKNSYSAYGLASILPFVLAAILVIGVIGGVMILK